MEKIKIRDYPCYKGNEFEITDAMLKDYSLRFPDSYFYRDEMVSLAKFNRDMTDHPYCNLPFCNTLESESMGGNVNFGNAKVGPRPGSPIVETLNQVLDLDDVDFSRGRIKEALEAASILKAEGEKVIFEISGPITILNGLIDSIPVFMAMRRDRETLNKLYKKLELNLLRFVEELVKRDVDLIYMADSSTAVNILGEKMLIQYLDDFVIGFVKEAEMRLGPKTLIHLCPKLGFGLVDSGRAEFIPIDVATDLTYAESFKEAIGKEKILGSRCIKNFKSKMTGGKLEAIRLK